MVASVTASSPIAANASKGITLDQAPKNKLKLDLDSIPENKVKVEAPGQTEQGKGLKIDMKV